VPYRTTYHPKGTARYGTARYGHLGKWPYWWARTAWYRLLVPVPQQLLGNRTKWPYWPVSFSAVPREPETNAMELGEGDHRAKWREQGVFRDPH